MSRSADLRALMAREPLVVAPGAYDGLTARLVEQAGFDAVYMTGAGTSMAHGFPDYGLLTASEMVDNAAYMAAAITVPLIADADTGYGNELNVTRAVREFERAGVSAIHIEDQVSPKKCGHLDGKEVITPEEFAGKIAAAAVAKKNQDFMIIARTDARAVSGLDDAVDRANRAMAAGADMIFLEAVQSLEELAAVPKRVNGPCLLNVVTGGKTPIVSFEDARSMGYRLAICPSVILRVVIPAVDTALRSLKASGLPVVTENEPSPSEGFRRMGATEWDALRREYS